MIDSMHGSYKLLRTLVTSKKEAILYSIHKFTCFFKSIIYILLVKDILKVFKGQPLYRLSWNFDKV